ncbi:hypothetical protein [Paraburkholderia sp. J63]|uniref:hypothetical protein n=1 Tax=Paraburkholderia sp. J63 TaxID=2805434 RepID=UPI002ABE6990|nr:hypothetical protein [Paraburkholderia sp. J63]
MTAPSFLTTAISAGLLLTFAFGGCTGPIAASLAMTSFGPQGIYVFTMTVTGSLALLALSSVSTRPQAGRG